MVDGYWCPPVSVTPVMVRADGPAQAVVRRTSNNLVAAAVALLNRCAASCANSPRCAQGRRDRDLLACRLQRLPDPLQRAVLGIKEVVESLLQIGAVLGRPDLFGGPEEFRSGDVGPERIRRGERLGVVEVDAVASGAEHLGSVGGDGRPVIGRGGGGEAVTSAVPVVDLLEAGVLEERGGQVVAGPLGRDAAAGLGGDGDGASRHVGLLGRRLRSDRQVAQRGGEKMALGLQAEDVAIGVVEASVLASDGGHDVHLPWPVTYGDPPAGVRIGFRGDSGGVHQALGDSGPLRVGEVRLPGVGADRADPCRLCGCTCTESFDGRVEGVRQVAR